MRESERGIRKNGAEKKEEKKAVGSCGLLKKIILKVRLKLLSIIQKLLLTRATEYQPQHSLRIQIRISTSDKWLLSGI